METTVEFLISEVSEPLPPEIKNKSLTEFLDEDLIDHLIECYRTYGFASRGPLIHVPTFVKQLKSKNNPPSPLLLNSFMAVVSLCSNDKRVLRSDDKLETAGEIFYERAMGLLNDYLDRARLSTVQALLMLTQFCIKSNEGSGRIWMLLGMAIRMSMDLALNRDCSKWNISNLEKAIRVRVFWCVMNAEIFSCASFGKPLPVYDYNTPYPYPIDEDDNPQEVINYMYFSKLLKIYGNTLQSKPYFSHSGSFRNTLPAIEAALRNWLLALPSELQYNPPTLGDPDSSTPLHAAYVNQVYNTIVISLHKPYINSDQYPETDSLDVCRKAANNITKLSTCMNIDSRAKFFTYNASLYCLSQAASIHLMDVSDPEFFTQGKMYMQKCLEAFRNFAEKCRLGNSSFCGVDDCRSMLETLFNVQLEKANEKGIVDRPMHLKSSMNRINELPKNASVNANVESVDPAPISSVHHQEPVDSEGDGMMSTSHPVIKKSPVFHSQIPTTNMIPPSFQLRPTSMEQSSYLTALPQDSQMFKPNPIQHHSQSQQRHVQPHSQHAHMNIPPSMVSLSSIGTLAEPPIVPSSDYYFARQNPAHIIVDDWDMVDLEQHQIQNTDMDNLSFNKHLPHQMDVNSMPLVDSNGSNFASEFHPNYVSYPMNGYSRSNAINNTNHMGNGGGIRYD